MPSIMASSTGRCGSPQASRAAGTVRLSAALRGGFVEIEMSDDGAGLDAAQLRASAVRKGLLTDDQASALDDATVMDVIFQPGSPPARW